MVKHLHELSVQRLQAVPIRRDEVEAAVDAIVDNVAAVQSTFIAQESLELVVDVLDYRLEAAETKYFIYGYNESLRQPTNQCCQWHLQSLEYRQQ